MEQYASLRAEIHFTMAAIATSSKQIISFRHSAQLCVPFTRPSKQTGLQFTAPITTILTRTRTISPSIIQTQRISSSIPFAASSMSQGPQQSSSAGASGTLICTSLTAKTVDGMLAEAQEALAAGADIVEIRLDYLENFSPETDLPTLLETCPLPVIVTFRPTWEGGLYNGEEAPRLAALKYAAALGADFIDIELKAAHVYFAASTSTAHPNNRVIISSHDYQATASEEELDALVEKCKAAGADIVKFATTAQDITDAARVLRVLKRAVASGQPTIALAMAERGQITRILAPKYGGFLTFGALSPERQSAPGQPTLGQLRNVFKLQEQNADTKIFGIVGNPVSHSRSPAIHNAAMSSLGFDGVYVPLLVDNMDTFLKTFSSKDWAGFSVTIPHKEAALKGATSADEVASAIGAANTLIRQADGTLKAYNTDWSAAISAIERGLGGSVTAENAQKSPLKGKTVVVVGAGGAGRALAFGAAARGANVVIANRSASKAIALAAQLNSIPPAKGVALEEVASGKVTGDVLVNTTSVGMHPLEDETPVPAAALSGYSLVFDAVYTPLQTRLLREAAAAGCAVVTGDEMFVGQAADQFRLFTAKEAPVELMRKVVLDSLK